MPARGLLITFEGPDGAGKSTQMRLMAQALEALGLPVLLTREPGGTPAAEAIRSLLLSPEYFGMDAVCEALLYAAARAEHVAKLIQPALDAGQMVLCDRFIDSSIAYQGYGRGLGEQTVTQINAPALRGTLPDITFLLWLDPEDGIRRNQDRPTDRLEMETSLFRMRVQQGFEASYAHDPHRVRRLDASAPPAQVHRQAMAALSEMLAAHGFPTPTP